MEIIVYMDHVEVEGQSVRRPDHISRQKWLESWERATDYIGWGCPECRKRNSYYPEDFEWTGKRS